MKAKKKKKLFRDTKQMACEDVADSGEFLQTVKEIEKQSQVHKGSVDTIRGEEWSNWVCQRGVVFEKARQRREVQSLKKKGE